MSNSTTSRTGDNLYEKENLATCPISDQSRCNPHAMLSQIPGYGLHPEPCIRTECFVYSMEIICDRICYILMGHAVQFMHSKLSSVRPPVAYRVG